MTFDLTFEQFKQELKVFHDNVGTMSQNELENAWKACGLAYLGMNEPMWQVSAAYALEITGRDYFRRLSELDPNYEPLRM